MTYFCDLSYMYAYVFIVFMCRMPEEARVLMPYSCSYKQAVWSHLVWVLGTEL